MTTEQPKFSNHEEEIEYWKKEFNSYKEKYLSAYSELNEFQMSSKELENELEMQLSLAESKSKELKSHNSKITMELENLREKYENLHKTSTHQITDLEDKITKLCEEKQKLKEYVRELEQTNDDLQRSNRVILVSLEDIELKFNQAIEKNAILENELDEKENQFLVSEQRLKDEARDLRQELAVMCKKETTSLNSNHHSNSLSSAITTQKSDLSITSTTTNSGVSTTTKQSTMSTSTSMDLSLLKSPTTKTKSTNYSKETTNNTSNNTNNNQVTNSPHPNNSTSSSRSSKYDNSARRSAAYALINEMTKIIVSMEKKLNASKNRHTKKINYKGGSGHVNGIDH